MIHKGESGAGMDRHIEQNIPGREKIDFTKMSNVAEHNIPEREKLISQQVGLDKYVQFNRFEKYIDQYLDS